MKKYFLIFISNFFLLFVIISCSPSGEDIAKKVCDCQEKLLAQTLFTRAEIVNYADSCRDYFVKKYSVSEKKEIKFDFERAEHLITESINKIQATYDKQLNILGNEAAELFKLVAEQKYISPQTMNHLGDSLLSIVCKNHNLNITNPVVRESFNLVVVRNAYGSVVQKFRSQPSFILNLMQMIYSNGYVNEYKMRTNTNINVVEGAKVLFYVVLPEDFNRTFTIPPMSFDALKDSKDKGLLSLFGISSLARLRNSFDENMENRVILNNIYMSSLDKRPVVYGKIIEKDNNSYKIFDSEDKRTGSQAHVYGFEVLEFDNVKVETSVIIDRIKNPEILKDRQGSIVIFSGDYKGYNQMSYSTSFSNSPFNQGLFFDNCEIIGIYKIPYFFDNVRNNIWAEYIKYCNSGQINIQNNSDVK